MSQTRREMIGALVAASTQAWAADKVPLSQQIQQRRPNVLLILADDLGPGDPGIFNPESRIPMPNFNRLATQGVRFTDMHSPSAVCTPTRYGLLTGQYCWRTQLKRGVLNGESPSLLRPGQQTLGSVMKARGYQTAVIGKWHLGLGTDAKADYTKVLKPSPLDFGFDSFYGIPASLDMPPYVWVENDRVQEAPTADVGAGPTTQGNLGPFWRAGKRGPSFEHEQVLPNLIDRAEKFVGQKHSRPWFLYLPLTGPHTPWLPTGKFKGKSGAGEYGDFAHQVDDGIGRVLRAIKQKNTLVIVTSDNGAHWPAAYIEKFGHRANGPRRGQKSDAYEAGHRVPFVMRWPGQISSGSICENLAGLIDVFPTLAGTPTHLDGVSLDAAVEGKVSRQSYIMQSGRGRFAVRAGKWKLIDGRGSGGFTPPFDIEVGPGEPTGELYDLASDPFEEKNLFLQRVDKVAELKSILTAAQSADQSGG
jgi:arylsulfatase A